LAEVQPVWPPPQITIEYGLLGLAFAGAKTINVATAAAKSPRKMVRSLTMRIELLLILARNPL
jgi:hypothetical protein